MGQKQGFKCIRLHLIACRNGSWDEDQNLLAPKSVGPSSAMPPALEKTGVFAASSCFKDNSYQAESGLMVCPGVAETAIDESQGAGDAQEQP